MNVAARYRAWLDGFPKEPQDRMAIALDAIAAYEAIERNGQANASDLELLVAAFCSPHKLVFETGCNLLVALAQSHLEVQQCLLQMARHKGTTARFHAIVYLNRNLPAPLLNQVVTLALGDRSSKVRGKGVEQAEGLGLTAFLPQLEEMQRTESDEFVLRQLAFHIPLLRDGYLVEPASDGSGFDLTVRGPDGSVGGPFISREEFSDERVRQEVARIRGGEDRLGQIVRQAQAKLRDENRP